VKSYCTVFPDSCVILNYIFNEEEFRPKTEFFSNVIVKGVKCEILPKVNDEILKKLTKATEDYTRIVRQCRAISQTATKKSLEKIPLVKETAELLEETFSEIFIRISRKHFPTFKQKSVVIRKARIVEVSVMLEFWESVERSEDLSLGAFLRNLEEKIKEKYIEFCDTQSLFMERLKAILLKKEDLLETSKGLEEMLLKSGVHNYSDIEVLCQAIGRMYKTKRWCAVVTTDYSDIIKRRMIIDRLTQLIVSDPLYFLYHLDRKIDCALNPEVGAERLKVSYRSFLKSPPDIGIV